MLKRWRKWLKNLTKPLLFLAVPVAVMLLFLALWKAPQWQVQSYRARFDPELVKKLDTDKQIQLEKDLITAENNARTTLAQILGGLALLSGLYLTWRNVRVAEEGKLTDRFSKAVELLGSKELDVRLGGIYALERIARDSPKDHWTVMEVLTASVRERAKNKPAKPGAAPDVIVDPAGELAAETPVEQALALSSVADAEKPKVATDIQAILTIIGRRKWVEQEGYNQKLNLFRADLRGANLIDAILTDASLIGANCRKAVLSHAKLSGTDFSGADLSGADLDGADLSGASFDNADLSETDLRRAKGYEWKQLRVARGLERAKLPPELEHTRTVYLMMKSAKVSFQTDTDEGGHTES